MLYISFAWTTAALLAGAKTVTRRAWKPGHAARFRSGLIVNAFDRLPYVGGQIIAQVRLTADARIEPDSSAPDSDYEAEGFRWSLQHWDTLPASARKELTGRGALTRHAFDQWRQMGGLSTVIRFELFSIQERTPS